MAGGALASLGLGQNTTKDEALVTLQSYQLVRQFIVDRDLVPLLCSTRAIKCHSNEDGGPLEQERRLNDAIKLFRDDLISVTDDVHTGMIRVSMTWYDRQQAADWCNGLIALANTRMQAVVREQSRTRLKFLEQEYEKTDVLSLRSSISTVMQNELVRAMDAGTKPDFAVRPVDQAFVPDDRYPVRPRKIIIGVCAGLIGALLMLAWSVYRRSKMA